MELQAFLEMDEITKYERFQELERIAYTDAMTGCRNKNWFIENRSRLEVDTNMVLIVDIDHFKQVNDTLGHEYGDTVLANVANIIQSVVRDTDTIRFGGEEFLIFLEGATVKHAMTVAERVRQSVSSHSTVTCSVGVSDTIENADKALYVAKNNGRNQIRRV